MLHNDLQDNRWFKLTLCEQMANIGSEIERAIAWRNKKNPAYAQAANERALELLDLTLSDRRHDAGLKEIARVRELWLDFFWGSNQYHQTARQWQRYFYAFNYAARNKPDKIG